MKASRPQATLAAVLAAWSILWDAGAARAADLVIERVVSPGGIEAWLAEDHSVPVIAMDFAFSGPAVVEPEGPAGTANLVSMLLDEGAGPYDSRAFQEHLQRKAIRLRFGTGRDDFSGSMKTLSRNADEAFDLTRLALSAPHFAPAAVERMRRAALARISQSLSDPGYLATRTYFATAFPGHPYGTPPLGTLKTVASIDEKALRDFVANAFTRANVMIGVAGDITPAALGARLDRVFESLPQGDRTADLPPATSRNGGETRRVSLAVPQSVVLVGAPGIQRDDPRWIAARLTNYTLGGGGFASRLMQEIRVKRGLTYGVSTSLISLDRAALIIASGATSRESEAEFLKVLKAEWQRMRQYGITQDELQAAKDHLLGALPLELTSSDKVAAVLLELQRQNLGIDYLRKREEKISSVTTTDVAEVARALLDPQTLGVVIVGRADEQ